MRYRVEIFMELRVSELAPARARMQMWHVRGCVRLARVALAVLHTRIRGAQRARGRERLSLCARTSGMHSVSDTYNGAPHKLLCARFGIGSG